MDREGAETYLRLLAEAAMRRSLAPAAELRAPGASTDLVVGHALTAVGALDPVTAEEILADFRLADDRAGLHREPGRPGVSAGPSGRHPGPGPACARGRLAARSPEAHTGRPARSEDRPTTGGPTGSSRSG